MTNPHWQTPPPDPNAMAYPPPHYQYPPAPQPTVLPVKTNHAMHLVLSLITCGMWLPVWVVVAMVNSGRTRKVY